jgi:hypothetical protein
VLVLEQERRQGTAPALLLCSSDFQRASSALTQHSSGKDDDDEETRRRLECLCWSRSGDKVLLLLCCAAAALISARKLRALTAQQIKDDGLTACAGDMCARIGIDGDDDEEALSRSGGDDHKVRFAKP